MSARVAAHPLADQLATRWNELHQEEEEEEGMTTQTHISTMTTRRAGPRKGMTHLEWAAEDLGVEASRSCTHCDGTGKVSIIRPADIARALTGSTATSGLGVMLSKVTEDPPLSMLRDVAKRLDITLDEAAGWLQKLHKAEVARRNGH